ncbi:MAG: hypothetical protein KAU48_07640, partial [Candidatus Thorarchaeota archaeon]|nr:hypothetical protein [Candidatus Thorarchaeota archaeon]
PMLLTISRWLVDSSPTVANISSWPYEPTIPYQLPMDLILVSGGIGVVLILVAVVILKRR